MKAEIFARNGMTGGQIAVMLQQIYFAEDFKYQYENTAAHCIDAPNQIVNGAGYLFESMGRLYYSADCNYR